MKRYIVLIIAFNSLFFRVSGTIPDSLENRLNRATSDTAKVMVYNRFVRSLLSGQNRDYHQAMQYAQEGYMLAEQVQFDKGRAELHRTMGAVCYYLNDYEQALTHFREALNICEKMQDIHGIASNYYNMCLIYDAQSKTYYSIDALQKALTLWKQLDNMNYQILSYAIIINLYRKIDEVHHAQVYAEEALSLALKTGNRHEEALLYDILALNNVSIGYMGLAEEQFHKSIQIFEELDDQLNFARVTVNLVENIPFNNPETNIALLQKAASIHEKILPDHIHLFDIYNIIANMFQAINQYDSTKYYKEKALSKAISSGIVQVISVAYDTIAMFYLKSDDIDLAEKRFSKAYEIALKNGLHSIQSSALSGLSSISYRKSNYKTAYEHLRKYQVINDSLTREENKKNVLKMTMQYEFEKDMTEKNETIKTQLERQQQAIIYQRTVGAIVSLALICAAILMVFIVRSNQRNRQTNKKLGQQHTEILRINDELKESHHELSTYKDNLEEMVEEQTAKLQQSEIQLRTLSNNLPGGCIYQRLVFDDGKEIISYVSSTAEKWLGISAEAIMNDINLYYQMMLPEDIIRKRALEQISISSMSSHTFEYRLKKGDQEIWLLENAMPHIDENRTIVWDGIVVDITDRKKFERELIKAKEHAEESDRLKLAFLANMSHEIRTPMNGIVGFLGFFERDDLSVEKRHDYTNIIRSNVQQLLQLIGDIVDISKMDSKQLALHYISFDLNNLLNELEIFFQDFIIKRDKNIELFLDRRLFISPGIIESDPVRIRQILSNLIVNAIKFTDKGYIRFGYKLTEHRDKLYFFVEDTGIGIPESKQEYIFERFRQANDEETQSTYGGTGLGLAISKNLVEMMDGKIGVESEEGCGSTFYFILPYG